MKRTKRIRDSSSSSSSHRVVAEIIHQKENVAIETDGADPTQRIVVSISVENSAKMVVRTAGVVTIAVDTIGKILNIRPIATIATEAIGNIDEVATKVADVVEMITVTILVNQKTKLLYQRQLKMTVKLKVAKIATENEDVVAIIVALTKVARSIIEAAVETETKATKATMNDRENGVVSVVEKLQSDSSLMYFFASPVFFEFSP